MTEIKPIDIDDEIIEQIFREIKDLKSQCMRNGKALEVILALIADLKKQGYVSLEAIEKAKNEIS